MLLAAVLGLSACNMDEEDFTYLSNSKQGSMEFKASMDGSLSLSKSYLQQSNGRWDVAFDSNDFINVFTKTGSASAFGIKELQKGGKTAVFSGDIDESDYYYAVYPLDNTSISGNVISAVVPDVQHTKFIGDNYSYYQKAAVSVAYTTGADKNFKFQNATALIKMQSALLDFNSVMFETVDGKPIAGNCAIEVSADGKVQSVSGGTKSEVYVSSYNGRNLVASLLPCRMKKGNLKITISSSQKTIVKYNSVDLDLKAGVLYNFAEICDCQVRVFNSASDNNPQVTILQPGDELQLPECDKPASSGMVWGYATSPNGVAEYLPGTSIVPDGDMDLYLVQSKGSKGNGIVISQIAPQVYSWSSQVSVTWDKSLDLDEDYIVEFTSSADNAFELQLNLSSNESGNCSYFGTSECQSMMNSYTIHSYVSVYGIKIDKESSTQKIRLHTLRSACDGHEYTHYNELLLGIGNLEGDFKISSFKIYKESDGPTGDVIDLLDGKAEFSEGSFFDIYQIDPVYETYSQQINCIMLDIPKKWSQTWDSQLYIKSDGSHKFVKDATYKFHCLIKADKEFDFGGGIHAEADGNHWKGGSPLGTKATTEWTYYEQSGTFDWDYVGDNNTYSSFAFDLSTDDAHVLYLADVSLEINGDEVIKNGDFKTNDFSSFQWKRDGVFDTPLTVETQTATVKKLVTDGVTIVK